MTFVVPDGARGGDTVYISNNGPGTPQFPVVLPDGATPGETMMIANPANSAFDDELDGIGRLFSRVFSGTLKKRALCM